ncbi:MAG: lipid-A-disaccharide synthase [Alphaproteobacteria bacterium]
MRGECFYILAGDTSADSLAARLMCAINSELNKPINWIGIGGEQMQKQGLETSIAISSLSLIGILDAVTSYNRLLKIAKEQVAQIMVARPKAIFTIDTKQFALKFAILLRIEMDKAGWHVPIIQLVAPTVWAWGPWRAKKFETAFDKILCLFPFEPSYFNPEKTDAIFVGHPYGYPSNQSKVLDHNSKKRSNLIGLFPGSRKREIADNLPDILKAAELFSARFPECQFILPTTSNLEKDVRRHLKNHQLNLELVVGTDAFDNCLLDITAAICVSGTATLQLSLHAIPAVTCYKTNPINFMLMKSLFKLKDPILPNILLQTEVYSCFLQSKQTPDNLSSALVQIYDDISSQHHKMIQHAQSLQHILVGYEDNFENALAKAINIKELY